MPSKPRTWVPKWSSEQLNADLEMFYARDWAKALKAYEKDPKDFHTAYTFLYHHPANQVRTRAGKLHAPDSYFTQNLDIMVVKVDPKTKRIETKKNKNWKKNGKGKRPVDNKRNTETNIWVEWGPWCPAEELAKEFPDPGTNPGFGHGMPSHDYRVDTGARTFEKAIVNLAHNVWMLYGDNADVPNGAKLKKKDRW